jgi:hypothetical protein
VAPGASALRSSLRYRKKCINPTSLDDDDWGDDDGETGLALRTVVTQDAGTQTMESNLVLVDITKYDIMLKKKRTYSCDSSRTLVDVVVDGSKLNDVMDVGANVQTPLPNNDAPNTKNELQLHEQINARDRRLVPNNEIPGAWPGGPIPNVSTKPATLASVVRHTGESNSDDVRIVTNDSTNAGAIANCIINSTWIHAPNIEVGDVHGFGYECEPDDPQ